MGEVAAPQEDAASPNTCHMSHRASAVLVDHGHPVGGT
jgi:hypothetical protein